MSLRSHLLLLTLVVLLPLALFGAGATLWVADRERIAFERGARQRTLALLTAVDTELDGHSETLRALASSYDLQTGDLPAFYRQAMRLLATKEDWRSIVLALPSGERVFDTALPLGTPLPILDRTGFDEALRRNEPTIGNLTGTLADSLRMVRAAASGRIRLPFLGAHAGRGVGPDARPSGDGRSGAVLTLAHAAAPVARLDRHCTRFEQPHCGSHVQS